MLKEDHKPVLKWEENFDQTNAFDTARWSKYQEEEQIGKNMSDFDSCYAMRDGK